MENYLKDIPFRNLVDFIQTFPTANEQAEYFIKLKWDGFPICPKCNEREHKFYRITNRPGVLRCSNCKHDFSIKQDTIFENSNIPISYWVWSLFEFCVGHTPSNKNANRFSMEQKSTWRMYMRLCKAVKDEETRELSGEIEIDECDIGPAPGRDLRILIPKYFHEKNQKDLYGVIREPFPLDKITLFGMRERGTFKKRTKKTPAIPGGNVVIKVVPDKKQNTLWEQLTAHVTQDSIIYSDGNISYEGLWMPFKEHYSVNRNSYSKYDIRRYWQFVDSKTRKPINEDVNIDEKNLVALSTNGIESVWQQFQFDYFNSLGFSVNYAQDYANAFMFRFNRRHLELNEMFVELLEKCLKTPVKRKLRR